MREVDFVKLSATEFPATRERDVRRADAGLMQM